MQTESQLTTSGELANSPPLGHVTSIESILKAVVSWVRLFATQRDGLDTRTTAYRGRISIIISNWSIPYVQVHWNQSETTCCGQGQFPTMQLKSTFLHNFCQIIFWYKTIYKFHNNESERLAWIPCFTNSGFVVKCKKRFDIVLMGIEARWEIIEYYMMK